MPLCVQVDDHLAELFLLEEPIEAAELKAAIRRATLANKFVPVFMGSAYKNKGGCVCRAPQDHTASACAVCQCGCMAVVEFL
jgi:translation elongation factor EF-G